jgi:hypothetical protein
VYISSYEWAKAQSYSRVLIEMTNLFKGHFIQNDAIRRISYELPVSIASCFSWRVRRFRYFPLALAKTI